MTGLQTDLYEITMAAGYFSAGKVQDVATFELFVRRLPPNRRFLVAAGLQQAVEYLENLRFRKEEVEFLRGLPQFAHVPPEFFDYLTGLRFSGDLFAVPEGMPVFANEPILTVRAPIIEAQIPETYLLSIVGFQTMIASKAVRVVEAAAGRAVVEFGSRRAHSPEAGVLAGRAAYIGGCAGTSNVASAFRYGVPVYGTAAHSWVMAFGSEEQAFRQLQKLFGPAATYVLDTYDTLEAARTAARLGRPLWGVRLDSDQAIALAHQVRRILDEAGLHDAKIMASGDLNEDKIRRILAANSPIDAFGVGTELSTSADAPSLSVVYKMAQIEISGIKRYTAKYSDDKQTLPGAKQIFRGSTGDLIGGAWECCPPELDSARALMQPVMLRGQRVQELPSVKEARERCRREIALLSENHTVGYSREMLALAEQVRHSLRPLRV